MHLSNAKTNEGKLTALLYISEYLLVLSAPVFLKVCFSNVFCRNSAKKPTWKWEFVRRKMETLR